MCGIGGILRTHQPGSPEAERLMAHLRSTPPQHSARSTQHFNAPAYELFHQPCRNGAPTADPVDAGPRPYGGTLPPGGGVWTIDEHWLDILEDSVKHRGPDGRGRFRDAAVRPDGSVVEVALIHRRLSIIDHEGGAQPMVSQGGLLQSAAALRGTSPGATARDGTPPRSSASEQDAPDHLSASTAEGPRPLRNGLVAVVFNGCIYNHRDLRQELEAKGHVFQTDHSDTEVLIHGWREWKMGLWQQLDGMFAVVLWDAAAAMLVVARDHFGEKPLYVSGEPSFSTWIASSVPLSFRRLIGTSAVDKLRVMEWVAFGCAPASTPLDDVRQVVPRGAAVWHGESRPVSTPHSPPSLVARRPVFHGVSLRTPPRLLAEIEKFLADAVARCIEADVPVGCFLSGGVDSSIVSLLAHRHRGDITTICVRMPRAAYDESSHAQQVAQRIGTRHITVDCAGSPSGDLVWLIESMGIPFGDSSLLPAFWASKAARSVVGVALAGDGGDELFLGYERYRAAQHLSMLAALKLPTAVLALGPRRDPKSPWSKIVRLGVASAARRYWELLAIFHAGQRERLINSALWNRALPLDKPKDALEARAFDIAHHLPGDMLRKVDAASMAANVEVRAPLLDRALAERVAQLSVAQLCPGGQRKGLLRAVARRYFPSEIVDRPKMGFAIPIGEWFRSDYGGMRQLLHDHLNSTEPFGPPSLGVEAMINMNYVRQMLREHDQAGERSIFPWRGRDHSQRLYMLLVLSIWAKWLGRL